MVANRVGSASQQSQLWWPGESEDPFPQNEVVTHSPDYKAKMLNGHDDLVLDLD